MMIKFYCPDCETHGEIETDHLLSCPNCGSKKVDYVSIKSDKPFTITEQQIDRGVTHGDFAMQAQVAQKLKMVFRISLVDAGKNTLPYMQMEAIEMILHKIGRIVAGDNNHVDHWHDIAGYSTIVENTLKEQ